MPTPPCPPLSLVSPPPTAAWATSPHFFHLKRRRLQSRLLKPSCNAARGLGLGSGRSSCFHYMTSRSREIGIDMQPQASICSPSIQGGPESNAPHMQSAFQIPVPQAQCLVHWTILHLKGAFNPCYVRLALPLAMRRINPTFHVFQVKPLVSSPCPP